MNKKEMETWTKNIQEKLGKESAGKIADELGKLITDNAQMNDLQAKQAKEIEDLKDSKDKLLSVNANLLQQIPMGDDEEDQPKQEEKTRKISYRDCFDDKGNFKI